MVAYAIGVGVGIVVNVGAGPDRMGLRHPGDELRAALPAADVVVLDDPARLPEELEQIAGSGVRALGIAGGDGSINTAARVALSCRQVVMRQGQPVWLGSGCRWR